MTPPARPRRPASVVAADEHRARRRRAGRAHRRSHRLRRALAAAAVAAPVLGLGWLVLLSPVLGVAQVDVRGTGRLTAAQVAAAAGVPTGTPLARVGVAEVAARVERALPPVQTVLVRRSWPRTLTLDVVERTAVAGVPRPDGVLLVSADGVPFAAAPTLPAGVVRLEVAQPGPGDPATQAALAVLQGLPADLRSRTGAIRAATASDVSLVLADGRTVVWGDAGDTGTKARALAPLLALPGSSYDVSAPGIVVRR